jgi:hypothetical protein
MNDTYVQSMEESAERLRVLHSAANFLRKGDDITSEISEGSVIIGISCGVVMSRTEADIINHAICNVIRERMPDILEEAVFDLNQKIFDQCRHIAYVSAQLVESAAAMPVKDPEDNEND